MIYNACMFKNNSNYIFCIYVVQVAKAVSHSLNNCVNCLPGQKDVDMALKSIGEASKKLLIETVSDWNIKCTVPVTIVRLFWFFYSDSSSFQVLPGGTGRVEPNGGRPEPVRRWGGVCLQRLQRPTGWGVWKVQPRLWWVPGCWHWDGWPHSGLVHCILYTINKLYAF